MIKKIISLMLVVCMLLTFIVSVSADASESAITAVISEVAEDGTFTVTFYVTPNEEAELQGYALGVNFDKDQIAVDSTWKQKNVFGELGDMADVKQYNNISATFVKAVWAGSYGMINGDEEKVQPDETGNIPLCVFKLKVLDMTASAGKELPVTFDVDTSLLSDGNKGITNFPTEGKVVVPGKTVTEDIAGLTITAKSAEYTGNVLNAADLVEINTEFGDLVEYTSNPAEIKNAGTYEVSATVLRVGYNPTTVKTTVVVAKKAVTLTVANATKEADAADPAFTATVEGLVAGDVLNYTLTRAAGEAAGEYAITAELGENANYDVTVVPGTLTINAKAPAEPEESDSAISTVISEVEEDGTFTVTFYVTPNPEAELQGYALGVGFDDTQIAIDSTWKKSKVFGSLDGIKEYNAELSNLVTAVWANTGGLINSDEEKIEADATGNIPLCVFKLKVLDMTASAGKELSVTFDVDTSLLSDGNKGITNFPTEGKVVVPGAEEEPEESDSAISTVISDVAEDGTFYVTFYVTPNAEAELQGYALGVNFDKDQIAVDTTWKQKSVFGELGDMADVKQYNNVSEGFVKAVWAGSYGMINEDEEKVAPDATGNIPLCVFKLKVLDMTASAGKELPVTFDVDTSLLSDGNKGITNFPTEGKVVVPGAEEEPEESDSAISTVISDVAEDGTFYVTFYVTPNPEAELQGYALGVNFDKDQIAVDTTWKQKNVFGELGDMADVKQYNNISATFVKVVWAGSYGMINGDEEKVQPDETGNIPLCVFKLKVIDLAANAGKTLNLTYDVDTSLLSDGNAEITNVPTTGTLTIPEFTYTYQFVNDDGQIIKSVTAKHGSIIETPEAPTKDSTVQYTYTFKEWKGFTEGMTLTGDITFIATFDATLNKYTYTFYDEDGVTELKKETVDYGTMITPPETPTKSSTVQYSYTFKEWKGFTEGMTLTGDVTFKAVFDETINQYTYKFLNEDGTVLKETVADYGSVIEAPEAPTKASTVQYSYTFKEWEGFTEGMTLTGDVTFKAVFDETINQYTYKFLNEDGTVLKETVADYGSVIEAPEAPTKASTVQYSYTFKEWEGFTEGMTLTGDVTFKAVFDETINQYTYKFLNEDGTVLKETVADYGSVIEAPEAPTKASTVQYSYTFKEWEGFTEGMTLTGDVTFKAVFDETINQYTYKFLNEDGTVLKETVADYGSVIEAPEAPTKASTVQYSYTFKEWEGFTEGMTLTGDVTFKAVFDETINQYTYKFLNEDGTVLKETVADYGSVIEAPQTPEKAADDKYTYVFVEWEGYADGMTLVKDVTFTAIYDAQIRQNIELSKVGAIVVGDSFTQNINFATLKSANCIACEIIYPDILELNAITPKEFEYATKDSLKTIDGYNYLTVTCQYRYDDVMIPQNTSVNPFELSFTVSKTAKPQEIEIRFGEDTYLLGDEEYQFENKINTKIGIRPKLAEYVMLTGAEEIFEPTKYNAEVYPDYTTDKEIVWTVDDETIATISKDGVLIPAKNGIVEITATAFGGARMSKTVKVHKKAYVDSFKSDIGIWKEKIAQDTKEYTILVPAGTKTIKITPFFSKGLFKYNDTVLLKNRAKEFVITADETILTLERSATEFDNCTYTIKIIRKPGLKNETVVAENFKEDCVNMLVYNNSVVHVDEKEDVTVTMPEATKNYKVLYWESLANLKPAAAPVEKTF